MDEQARTDDRSAEQEHEVEDLDVRTEEADNVQGGQLANVDLQNQKK